MHDNITLDIRGILAHGIDSALTLAVSSDTKGTDRGQVRDLDVGGKLRTVIERSWYSACKSTVLYFKNGHGSD
jgi:hypothetical protein